jgi:hypothetical protein
MQVIMGWRLSQHKHFGIYYQTTANLVQVFAQLTNTVSDDQHMPVGVPLCRSQAPGLTATRVQRRSIDNGDVHTAGRTLWAAW